MVDGFGGQNPVLELRQEGNLFFAHCDNKGGNWRTACIYRASAVVFLGDTMLDPCEDISLYKTPPVLIT